MAGEAKVRKISQDSAVNAVAPRAIETPRRQSVNLPGEVRMQKTLCLKETPM